MSINKFGLAATRGGGGDGEKVRRGPWSSGVSKTYIRENCLCADGEVFDAKSRVIRHLASPEADTDAINKLHLEHRFELMNDDLNDRTNRNRMLCETSTREVLSRLEDLENTEQTWKKDHDDYIETRCLMLERQIHDLRLLLDESVARLEREIINLRNSLRKDSIKYYDYQTS